MNRARVGIVVKVIFICLVFCCIAIHCKAEREETEAEKTIIKSKYVNRGDKGYNFEYDDIEVTKFERINKSTFLHI